MSHPTARSLTRQEFLAVEAIYTSFSQLIFHLTWRCQHTAFVLLKMKSNIENFPSFQVHNLLEINSSCYVKENCSGPATADMRRNVKETFLLQMGMNFLRNVTSLFPFWLWEKSTAHYLAGSCRFHMNWSEICYLKWSFKYKISLHLK